jgi:hypothetical protein
MYLIHLEGFGEVIDHLGDVDAVDSAHEPGQRERQHIACEARMNTRAVKRGGAIATGRLDLFDLRVIALGPVPGTHGGDHVLARPQEPANHVDILDQRRKVHAVDVHGEDLLGLVRRDHAGGGLHASELAGIFADFLGVRHQDPDQLIRGVADEMPNGDSTDLARSPLHDAIGFLRRHDEFPPARYA